MVCTTDFFSAVASQFSFAMEPAAKRARPSSPEPDGYETKIDRFPTYHTDANGKKITYLTTVWTDSAP